MGDRSGRRRRHKRHKARMLRHPVRSWRLHLLGGEFRAMQEFTAKSVQRGCYIDQDGGLAFADCDFVQVARLDYPFASWTAPGTLAMPPVSVTTYRLNRRREGRLFYDGRNRRYRELPATMEEVSNG